VTTCRSKATGDSVSVRSTVDGPEPASFAADVPFSEVAGAERGR
jgi:hypothetical protein